MKKLIVITGLFLVCFSVESQNITEKNGNVGIGTTEPVAKLDVRGDISIKYGNSLKVHTNWNGNGNDKILKTGWISERGNFLDLFVPGNGASTESKIAINQNGNIGIGTSSPLAKLHVNSAADVGLNQNPALLIGERTKLHIDIDGNEIGAFNNNSFSTLYINASGSTSNTVLNSSGGNVGIGTSSPLAKLHVNSAADVGLNQNPALLIGERTKLHIDIDGNEIGAFNNNSFSTLYINGSGSTSNTVLNDSGGNVGIGTTNPKEKFEIGSSYLFHDGGHKVIGFLHRPSGVDMDNTRFSAEIRFDPIVGNFRLGTSSSVTDSPVTHFNIDKNGKIGIGTIATGSHKLAVEGSIGAREIKVQSVGWADFVFEDKYELPTLKEVENYINEKGHLKDIPSAEEVTKKGIYLGEMNSKLLQKIEELTLYTIQQEKKIKEQEINLKMLLKRVEKLERK